MIGEKAYFFQIKSDFVLFFGKVLTNGENQNKMVLEKHFFNSKMAENVRGSGHTSEEIILVLYRKGF